MTTPECAGPTQIFVKAGKRMGTVAIKHASSSTAALPHCRIANQENHDGIVAIAAAAAAPEILRQGIRKFDVLCI